MELHGAMGKNRGLIGLVLGVVLVSSACGGSTSEDSGSSTTSNPSSEPAQTTGAESSVSQPSTSDDMAIASEASTTTMATTSTSTTANTSSSASTSTTSSTSATTTTAPTTLATDEEAGPGSVQSFMAAYGAKYQDALEWQNDSFDLILDGMDDGNMAATCASITSDWHSRYSAGQSSTEFDWDTAGSHIGAGEALRLYQQLAQNYRSALDACGAGDEDLTYTTLDQFDETLAELDSMMLDQL